MLPPMPAETVVLLEIPPAIEIADRKIVVPGIGRMVLVFARRHRLIGAARHLQEPARQAVDPPQVANLFRLGFYVVHMEPAARLLGAICPADYVMGAVDEVQKCPRLPGHISVDKNHAVGVLGV